MHSKETPKNHSSFYELALYLAVAKAQQNEFRWEAFIDDVSQICDRFATHIASQGIPASKLSRR